MWPLPAPGQVFSVGVGLSFVLLCRLSRVPCPLFCLELTSLWQLPVSFLDSHQDSFCSVFTGSDSWSSQVVCGDPSGVFPWLRVLPHVRALSRFWFNVSWSSTSFASGHRCSPDFRSSLFSLSFFLGPSVFRVRSHGRSGKSSARCVSGPHWFCIRMR